MPSFPLRQIFTGLKARYHLWNGRRAYRMGAYADAGAHYLKAIAEGFESFEATLALGKIYLRQQDFHRAGAFFHRARMIDPSAFLLEGFPEDFVESLRSEAPRALRPHYSIVITSHTESAPGTGPASAKSAHEDRDRSHANAERGTRSHGDQGSGETAEPSTRPALGPEDGRGVDWDAEARKLFDD